MQMNNASQGKWLWRASREGDRLWRRVVEARWGVWSGGDNRRVAGKFHRRCLWKKIVMGRQEFMKCTKWCVGAGDKIRFCDDEWVGSCRLKDKYPRIFAIAQNRNMYVREVYIGIGEDRVWNVQLNRNLNDWEIKDYQQLMRIVSQANMGNTPDCKKWTLGKDGIFAVKSYYRQLTLEMGVPVLDFPFKQVWKTKAPPRMTFFTWKACKGSILTINMLMRRGRCMVNRCYLCKMEAESCNHLLLWCPVVYRLWSMIYGLLGIK